MHWKNRAVFVTALLFLTPALLLNCNTWTPLVKTSPSAGGQRQVGAGLPPTPQPTVPQAWGTSLGPTPDLTKGQVAPAVGTENGEPAGCRTADDERQVRGARQSLAYADELLGLGQPLAGRILDLNWDPRAQKYAAGGAALTLQVSDVKTMYMIQRMMNALQVAGFVTWLHDHPQQGLQILAIPMRGDWADTTWEPYMRAYWQSPQSVPADDPYVVPVQKVPPCHWEVEYGAPVKVDASWWPADAVKQPDYVQAASAYLADSNEAAMRVARRINWLGDEGLEGPNTMCGPLAWSIMHDAGAFPPGYGGWSVGAKAFWLAKPSENGRPWSLFPKETYHQYAFHEPLGTFDFSAFPLFPGDFLYMYSHEDGFDHMLVVTEVDGEGNVYTVTNKVQVEPEKKVTIERLLLLNLNDPAVGIARNQWARDRVNGRTGDAGFEVFRWAWMEKDQQGQALKYFVQPGDTLASISALWRTPAGLIARYNEITVETQLTVGQRLRIPPNDDTGR